MKARGFIVLDNPISNEGHLDSWHVLFIDLLLRDGWKVIALSADPAGLTGKLQAKGLESGANLIVERFDAIDASREAMQSVALDAPRQAAFARAALALRYPDADPDTAAPVTETQLLDARRPEDRAPDLWTVFNRVQEHLTRGGLAARSARGRRMRTRPVQGIDSSVQLNRALWVLAEEMRRLAA